MDQYFFREQDGSGLYLVEDSRRGPEYTCDIIVIHGLSGGPTSTWRHPATNIIWFRDLLPEHIRDETLRTNARIWTFGYNANAAFSTAQAGVHDHAKALLNRVRTIRSGHERHKIIWVCHSLGGIIVKSALIEAMLNPTYRPIRDTTVGIVFLGTPHQGSRIATMASIAARIAKKTMFMNPATSLLKTLERDSEPLFERVGQFSNICEHIKVCSFFETLPMGHTIIVERLSALTNLPGEFQMPLDADHVGICRYRNNNDQNFLAVLDCIKELMKLTAQAHTPLSTPSGTRAPVGFRPPSSTLSNQRSGSWPSHQQQGQDPYLARDPRNQYYQYQNPQAMPDPRNQGYVAYRAEPPRQNPYPSSQLGPYQEHMRAVAHERSYTQESPADSYSTNSFRRPPPPSSQTFPGPTPPTRPPKQVTEQFPNERNTRNMAPQAQSYREDFGWSPRVHGDVNPVSMGSSRSEIERPVSPANSQYSESVVSTNSAGTTRSSSTSAFSSTASAYTAASTPVRTPIATPILTPAPTPAIIPAPTPAVASTPAPSNTPDASGWRCDVCMNEFTQSDSRVRCLECYDYDLCMGCYEDEQISNSHTLEHKTVYIVTSSLLSPADLVPAELCANPEYSPPRKLPNWTVGNSEGARMLHLYKNPGHARFLVTNISPRVYMINLEISFFISKQVSAAVLDVLKKEGLGKLRIAVGTPIDNRVFFRGQRKEDENLSSELFESGTYQDYLLKIPDGIVASEGWVQGIDLPGVVHAQRVMGILLQWSDVQEFQKIEDPVLSIAITGVRLKEPLEYDEEPKPMPKATPAPPPPVQKVVEEDDSGEQITLEMIYVAVAQHLQQQEDEKITLNDIYRALALQQQQAQQTADLYTVALLLRFRAYLEALEKKNKEEEEQERLNEAFRRLKIQAYLQALEEQKREEEEKERQQALLQQLVYQRAAQEVLYSFLRQ